MKIHPRAKLYHWARNDLDVALVEIIDRHELTSTEVSALLTEKAAWWTRQTMHEERKLSDYQHTDNTAEHLEEAHG